MTPRELIRLMAADMESAGVPDAEIDASLLLSHITGQNPMNLRLDSWSQVSFESESAFRALCEKRKELDVLGVGAYDSGRLVGLAGCSADCEEMYQIGVDVLPEYRRQGIASAVTSRLAMEVLALDKVPFYCAAWCNIKSVRNAIRSGFRPAWVEITAKDSAYVAEMNEV